VPKSLSPKTTYRKSGVSSPPGRLKIMKAMRDLLAEREFSAITWADIARTAAVNEGLIYKYFKDTRNLLNEVLNEFLEPYVSRIQTEIKGRGRAINKLKKFISLHFDIFNSDRVFAKILLLEVRNHPGYFQSDTYKLVQRYTTLLLELIKEGMDQGDIRQDISPRALRQILLGSIEHCCLPGVIFQKKCFPNEMTRQLCTILFDGIRKR
jgi:TetR/AcrR family transcriptional regulator, fatty acid metabolism regulator protein